MFGFTLPSRRRITGVTAAVIVAASLVVGVEAPSASASANFAKQINVYGTSRNLPIGGSWLDRSNDTCGKAKFIVTQRAYFSKITSKKAYLTKVVTTYKNIGKKKGPAIWGGNVNVYSTKNFFHRSDYDRGPVRGGETRTWTHVANKWVGYSNHRFVVSAQVVPNLGRGTGVDWYCGRTYASQLIYRGA